MASSVLNFLLVGTDAGASRAIARIGAAAEATSKSIASASDKQAAAAARVSKAFNAVGKASTLIAVGIGIVGVKAAVSFEAALTRVSTQAGVSQKDLKGLGDALLKLSPKVGFDPNDLALSLYHVESAFASTGISAGKAIDIVAQASKLAKIGRADLGDTTQAIIGVLASGIKGVKDATDAAAQLNQLVGSGDTTLSAVDKAIASGILPTSHALGLSFKDVAAAIATLTDNATPADEAATRLRTTFSTIEKPTKAGIAALDSIGLSSVTLAEDFRKPDGLLVAMSDLKTHLEATYPSSRATKLSLSEIGASTKSYVGALEAQGVTQKTAVDLGNKYAASLKAGGSAATQQAQTILAAFGGAKSGSTFLTLYEELTRLQSKYKDFGTSAQAAAKFQTAWAQQQGTTKQKLDDLKAAWDVFLIRIGNAILPALKNIVDVLAQHPGIIKAAAAAVALLAAAWTVSKFANAFSVLGKLTAAILGIGTASTTAATETAAANLGGAASGAAGAAEGAAAGGAARGGLLARLGLGAEAGGLLAGGALVAGVAGLAGAIHEIITDGQVKNLPALDKLSQLIASGGLSGTPGADAIAAGLTAAGSGNNRNESDFAYLQRILGDKAAIAKVQAQYPNSGIDLSIKGLFKTIQTGDKGQIASFIQQLHDLGFALKGSPDTVQKVGDYLQALWSRYNSARVAAGGLTKAQKLQTQQNFASAVAANYLSTNVASLAKTYHVSGAVAKQLAADNGVFMREIPVTVTAMKDYGVTLDKNTSAGRQNITQVQEMITLAKQNAADVKRLTGSQDLANISLRSASTAFEDAAVKAGFNKQQVDTLIRSLGGLPPNPTSTVHLNGVPEAQQSLASLEQSLRSLAQPIIIPILTQSGLLGVASPNYVPTLPQILTHPAAPNYTTVGHHAMGGVFKGWSWVGEHGKELIHVGSPSMVLPHGESMAVAGARSGGDTYVTVHLSTLDTKTAEQALRGGLAKTIAIEVKRATGNGLKLH